MARERRNPPSEELYARKWQIFAVTMIGLFMALIDVTIVNITIPTLQHEFDAPVDTVSLVLNAYNIMFAVLLVSMGRLGGPVRPPPLLRRRDGDLHRRLAARSPARSTP